MTTSLPSRVSGAGRDGDSFLVNYVAHPMQGAISGFVQIHNDPKARPTEFSESKAYWQGRLKAMGWAALFSTQFELGPISEASLGNVIETARQYRTSYGLG